MIDLAILEMSGGAPGDIGMRRGGHHHHDHLGPSDRLAHIRGGIGQFAKAVRPALGAFQLDPAALLDHADVVERAVVQRDLQPHQCQVGRHGLAAMPGADDRVFFRGAHICSFPNAGETLRLA